MDTKVIWEKYHQDLKRFVFSKIKDEQMTEDLLQEIFIKVHTKINQLTDKNKLKPWLFTIARNIVMDSFNERKLLETLKEEDVYTEEESDAHSEQDCLPGIINHLPVKYRRPLYLADVKGLKQMKIAEKLKLPLPTIKSQIQRGRKLITQGYMECCDYKLNEKGKLVGERREKSDCKVCH